MVTEQNSFIHIAESKAGGQKNLLEFLRVSKPTIGRYKADPGSIPLRVVVKIMFKYNLLRVTFNCVRELYRKSKY